MCFRHVCSTSNCGPANAHVCSISRDVCAQPADMRTRPTNMRVFEQQTCVFDQQTTDMCDWPADKCMIGGTNHAIGFISWQCVVSLHHNACNWCHFIAILVLGLIASQNTCTTPFHCNPRNREVAFECFPIEKSLLDVSQSRSHR